MSPVTGAPQAVTGVSQAVIVSYSMHHTMYLLCLPLLSTVVTAVHIISDSTLAVDHCCSDGQHSIDSLRDYLSVYIRRQCALNHIGLVRRGRILRLVIAYGHR